MLERRRELTISQTNGLLKIGVRPEILSLGDAGISASIYNVLSKCFVDECVSISCDDLGPKCSAELRLGEADGVVSIDYIASCEEGIVNVDWFSDDGVNEQVVDDHVRVVIEEAHCPDYHPQAS